MTSDLLTDACCALSSSWASSSQSYYYHPPAEGGSTIVQACGCSTRCSWVSLPSGVTRCGLVLRCGHAAHMTHHAACMKERASRRQPASSCRLHEGADLLGDHVQEAHEAEARCHPADAHVLLLKQLRLEGRHRVHPPLDEVQVGRDDALPLERVHRLAQLAVLGRREGQLRGGVGGVVHDDGGEGVHQENRAPGGDEGGAREGVAGEGLLVGRLVGGQHRVDGTSQRRRLQCAVQALAVHALVRVAPLRVHLEEGGAEEGEDEAGEGLEGLAVREGHVQLGGGRPLPELRQPEVLVVVRRQYHQPVL
mmetsp:Transcript_9376/g.19365  ORF Transcript_9376/g.19365 Transcript_9376/m.19365 type:complete len:308 (+) Transcript_9376:393-1316(+)